MKLSDINNASRLQDRRANLLKLRTKLNDKEFGVRCTLLRGSTQINDDELLNNPFSTDDLKAALLAPLNIKILELEQQLKDIGVTEL